MSAFIPAISSCVACAALLSLYACTSETLDGGSNTTSSASAEAAYSCDNRGLSSQCDAIVGATRTWLQGHCDGTVIDGPCPTANAIGFCDVTFDGGRGTKTYYSDGSDARTQDSARKGCEAILNGTFRTR